MKEGARKGAESWQRLITTGQLGIGSQGGTWCLVVAVLVLSCPRPSGLANTRSKWLCGPAVCVLSLKSGLSTEESDLPLASWYSEDPEELADQWLGTGNSTVQLPVPGLAVSWVCLWHRALQMSLRSGSGDRVSLGRKSVDTGAAAFVGFLSPRGVQGVLGCHRQYCPRREI